MTDWRVLSIGV